MGLLIMKVVIVGGGAGGISTASNIRKLDQDIEITVLTRDNKVAYSPCAIPYVLSGTIESFDDIVMRTPEDYKKKNIDVITEVEVTEVDSDKKTVTYEQNGKKTVMDYDKLVLATGGNPFVPPMQGVELDGVFRIRNIDDGIKVQEAMKDAKSAIVTGAGLIGIEIAYALKKQGLNVILSEMLPQIVPRSLDKDMSDILVKYLEMEGINVVLGKPITKLIGDGKVEKACFGDEDIYDADEEHHIQKNFYGSLDKMMNFVGYGAFFQDLKKRFFAEPSYKPVAHKPHDKSDDQPECEAEQRLGAGLKKVSNPMLNGGNK